MMRYFKEVYWSKTMGSWHLYDDLVLSTFSCGSQTTTGYQVATGKVNHIVKITVYNITIYYSPAIVLKAQLIVIVRLLLRVVIWLIICR